MVFSNLYGSVEGLLEGITLHEKCHMFLFACVFKLVIKSHND